MKKKFIYFSVWRSSSFSSKQSALSTVPKRLSSLFLCSCKVISPLSQFSNSYALELNGSDLPSCAEQTNQRSMFPFHYDLGSFKRAWKSNSIGRHSGCGSPCCIVFICKEYGGFHSCILLMFSIRQSTVTLTSFNKKNTDKKRDTCLDFLKFFHSKITQRTQINHFSYLPNFLYFYLYVLNKMKQTHFWDLFTYYNIDWC